ncbi:MAG: hypothetical protein Q9209_005828 [Squamulea sp. 1 TL-2023]
MAAIADLAIIRNNFSLSTWLLLGAFLQSLVFAIVPPRVAALPTIFILVLVGAKNLLISGGYLKNPYLGETYKGKWTAPLREDEKEGDKVAVFFLGASSNHPLGIFTPGFGEITPYLQSMWVDAEADPIKSGLIGKSTALMSVPTSAASSGPAIFTMSYWKSIEHLHAFAQGPSHRKGWDWWSSKARKEFPHIGIMHETFEAPKGRWENIYEGFVPVGMGALTRKVMTSSGEERHEQRLVEARSGRWSTMNGRLGMNEEKLLS